MAAAGNYSAQAAQASQVEFERPIPLSETAERIAADQIAFYSYPKYYRNASGDLAEVDTNFRSSPLADWDYEVSMGIWRLLIRKDGTFSARHSGDTFTYRLMDYGLSNKEGFCSLAKQSPNWDSFIVAGNKAIWSDVFPGVNLEIEYIHDILKVNLYMSQNSRDTLAAHEYARAHPEAKLVYRFDIQDLFLQPSKVSDALQEQALDQDFEITGALNFSRSGKVRHSIVPAKAWVQDDASKPLRDMEPISLSQTWCGKESQKHYDLGIGLDEFFNAPDGTLVLDPTTIFEVIQPSSKDSLLSGETNYGSETTVSWYDDDHFVLAFNVGALNNGIIVAKAELSIYEWYSSIDSNIGSRAYNVTEYWDESLTTWTYGWTTPGGDYTTTNQSPEITLPDDDDEWITWDVTDAFDARFPWDKYDIEDYGFLVRMLDSTSGKIKLYTSEYATVSLRPKLIVTYESPSFGVDVGNGKDDGGNGTPSERQIAAQDDNVNIVRYFMEYPEHSDLNEGFMEDADENDMKVIPVFRVYRKAYDDPLETPIPVPQAAATFAAEVKTLLTPLCTQIKNRTIVAIELGNEVDAGFGYTMEMSPIPTPWQAALDRYYAGRYFGEYYYVARQIVKAEWPDLPIISGGSPNLFKAFGFPDAVDESSPPEINGIGQHGKAFLSGFIDWVTAATTQTPGVDPYEILPEIMGIHGYPLEDPPEEFQDKPGNGSTFEYLQRYDYMLAAVETRTAGQYSPEIAATEYDTIFWATERPTALPTPNPTDSDLGLANFPTHIEAPERQAIHFLRRILLDATLENYHDEPAIKYSMYFHHPMDMSWDAGNMHSFSHNPYGTPVATPRPILKVAREMYDPGSYTTPRPALGQPGTTIWGPANSTSDNASPTQTPRVMNVGWETRYGEKWGAIWRYKNRLAHLPFPDDPEVWEYYEATPINAEFKVEGDYRNLAAELYQFDDMGNVANYDSNSLEPVSGTPIPYSDYIGGITTYEIPNVSHNPFIIHFVNE